MARLNHPEPDPCGLSLNDRQREELLSTLVQSRIIRAHPLDLFSIGFNLALNATEALIADELSGISHHRWLMGGRFSGFAGALPHVLHEQLCRNARRYLRPFGQTVGTLLNHEQRHQLHALLGARIAPGSHNRDAALVDTRLLVPASAWSCSQIIMEKVSNPEPVRGGYQGENSSFAEELDAGPDSVGSRIDEQPFQYW